MKHNCILFDLDGTISDSSEGIINAIMYALEKLDSVTDDMELLRKFIGPPLLYAFSNFMGFDEEKSARAVALYREYYPVKGLFENKLYPGIKELLSLLKEKGCCVILATSKPEPYALKILEYFGILQYFDYVTGAKFNEKTHSKADVIKQCLQKSGCSAESALMVGDTGYDIQGAKSCGIKSVAVLYGFGKEEELKEADYIAKDVEELKEILLN